MKEEIFFDVLNVNSIKLVLEKFYKTLLITNRTFDFFVNWEKIVGYLDEYLIELNILSSLIRNKKFEETLRTILNDYPKVLPLIPMLLAIRNQNVSIIDDFYAENVKNHNIDFCVRDLSNKEIDEIIIFFKETGLKDFFLNLSQKSIPDYYIGIEVGLDTHARKNRSGKVMEDYINKRIIEINQKMGNSLKIINQKKYKYLKEEYSINITSSLLNRKADFLIIKNDGKIIAIETNFYSGTGSKPQEIVNSYIQRQDELKKLGIDFIWITDGLGWRKQRNQMNFAFNKLDFVLNIAFIKKGLLKEIILSI